MIDLTRHKWEVTHLSILMSVVMTLTIAAHLFGTRLPVVSHAIPTSKPQLGSADSNMPASSEASPQQHPVRSSVIVKPTPPVASMQVERPPVSNPRQVVVGPATINNRYTLTSIHRSHATPTQDELSIHLHIDSLATPPLVSPYESDMLSLNPEGREPIHSEKLFRAPIPAGETRDEDIPFLVPADLRLDRTRLRIHYYNYEKEISLGLVEARESP